VPRIAGEPLVYKIYFQITYKDAAENKYKQTVYCIQLENIAPQIHTSTPELIG